MRSLGLLWRGSLRSCNYACPYCPFAKRRSTSRALTADRHALERFVQFVASMNDWSLEILFTPYGEALIWSWYQQALARLSRLPNLRRVAIQTNGSAPTAFLADCDLSHLALWISWHPSEIARAAFADKIIALHSAGARLSVGAVAIPAHLAEVEALCRDLPVSIPVWINAEKSARYDSAAIARWSRIDPGFPLEADPSPSGGRPCAAGESVLSIDAAGTIRRCHFVDHVLGNLYTDDLTGLLGARPCPRPRCDCFIGYAHRPELNLRELYGDDLLCRIPRRPLASCSEIGFRIG
jgi:MoaA/NifB/PqqE/SkfB family radical SAM enzyme